MFDLTQYMTHLCVDLPSSVVDVAKVVTQLVVARVIPLTSDTTKLLCLLLGLDALGTSSDTTGGDTTTDESIVVAAAVKGDEGVVETLLLVPVDIQVTQLLGTGGVLRVGSIVDLVGKVGAAHHVIVHEEADLAVLLLGEDGNVVVGTKEALLLSGPPGEAHAVVDPELGKLGGDLEDGDTAGAVVVDTRTLGDTVTVATEHHTVLGVAVTGLGDDVGGGDGLDLGVNVRNSINLLAILELLSNSLTFFTAEAESSDMVGRRSSQGSMNLLLLIVVHHSGDSTSLASILRLGTEGTGSSQDESNVTLEGLRIVGLAAALVLDEDEVSVYGLLVLGGRSQTHGRRVLGHRVAEDEARLENVARHGRELLVRHGIVTAQLGQLSVDVGQCAEMA